MHQALTYQADSLEDVAAHLDTMAVALEAGDPTHVRGMEKQKAQFAEYKNIARGIRLAAEVVRSTTLSPSSK